MISVCIATHNGQKYILDQLLSILPQLDSNDEILISDDNSSDETLNIIYKIDDKRIVIFNNYFNNPIKNFEFLINESKGDIIFLSDQDDLWDPQKVKKHFAKHNIDTNPKLVLSDIELIDSYGLSINKFFYNKRFTSTFFLNILKNNFIGCSMSFSKDIKKSILPFPSNIPMHDWWIGLISSLFYSVEFINEKLVFYRIHENNFTKKNTYNFYTKVKFRFILIKYLFITLIKK